MSRGDRGDGEDDPVRSRLMTDPGADIGYRRLGTQATTPPRGTRRPRPTTQHRPPPSDHRPCTGSASMPDRPCSLSRAANGSEWLHEVGHGDEPPADCPSRGVLEPLHPCGVEVGVRAMLPEEPHDPRDQEHDDRSDRDGRHPVIGTGGFCRGVTSSPRPNLWRRPISESLSTTITAATKTFRPKRPTRAVPSVRVGR